ncbi:hypothetical protein C943_00948 [Mariniradius saccharolyticus AK6]|uniref:Uncharacterized protein n=1 Tax=Mariniradius saccharolyticus AK6 TaxID=1239962 RepID=M7Y6T7_9BACT|nr:hypothetical protein C943_00948 [Mariniradius saccharolyticus AK6]
MLWASALFGLTKDVQANTKIENKRRRSELKKAYRNGRFVMGRQASIPLILV